MNRKPEYLGLNQRISHFNHMIEKSDPLKLVKKDAITAACELLYSDDICQKIVSAKTEAEIDRYLHGGRTSK